MSFIGREVLFIPPGVVVKQHKGFLVAIGQNGFVKKKIELGLLIRRNKNRIAMIPRKSKISSFFSKEWGSLRMSLWKMLLGIFNLFNNKLIFVGIGYKFFLSKKNLGLRLGYSHGIKINLPKNLKIVGSDKRPPSLYIEHTDYMKLKSFCSKLQSLKPPEPYKGKGILFHDQKILRKVGKKKKN